MDTSKRTRLGVESGEISFLQKVAGVSIGEEFSHLRETQSLDLELLLPEKSQLKWLGYLTRTPPGCLMVKVFCVCPARRMPWGRTSRTHWRDYTSRRV